MNKQTENFIRSLPLWKETIKISTIDGGITNENFLVEGVIENKNIEVKLLDDGTLDYDDFKLKINEKTVLVAMGMASNSIGTINDFIQIKDYLKNYNCLLLLDAVHYAPHFSINVKDLECDFLLCSAYKFYGPHIGLLYSKPGLLEKIQPERLIVQDQFAPFIIETGTLNHAACNGVTASINFIASLGNGKTDKE